MADRNMAERYAKAKKLLQKNKPYKTAKVFAGLDGYRDATEQFRGIRETCYQAALKKKRYELRWTSKDFIALSDYKDSVQQIVSTQYAKSDCVVYLQRYQDVLSALDAMKKSGVSTEKICEVERTFAAIIEKSGKVSADGSRITNLCGGVRPAIFIKL